MTHAVIPHRNADAFFTGSACQRLDELVATALGVPTWALMQRAGEVLFNLMSAQYPDSGQMLICCGTGNNAGDGYVLARQAKLAGWQVVVVQIDGRTLQQDAGQAQSIAQQAGVTVLPWRFVEAFDTDPQALRQALQNTLQHMPQVAKSGRQAGPLIVVDALLGTGVSSPPRNSTASLIRGINQMKETAGPDVVVVAVDIPSGLAADRTGPLVPDPLTPDQVVKADVTVTFLGAKLCLASGAGAAFAGQVHLAYLGAPTTVHNQVDHLPALRLNPDRLPQRKPDAYKHQQGSVVVVGGDLGMGGAVALAAEAALRAGAGLVFVITRAEHVAPLLSRCPELMVQDANDIGRRQQLLAQANVVVLGPGLGTAGWGRALFAEALSLAQQRVVDADGLNLLAESAPFASTASPPHAHTIVTPHSGEAARLLGTNSKSVDADRVASVTELARLVGGVAVLKGPGTLVAQGPEAQPATEGPTQLCTHGNSAMATAGMGDVLAGLTAGLWAQGLPPIDAAAQAVAWHSATADALVAQGRRSLLASDLFGYLDRVLLEPIQTRH